MLGTLCSGYCFSTLQCQYKQTNQKVDYNEQTQGSFTVYFSKHILENKHISVKSIQNLKCHERISTISMYEINNAQHNVKGASD